MAAVAPPAAVAEAAVDLAGGEEPNHSRIISPLAADGAAQKDSPCSVDGDGVGPVDVRPIGKLHIPTAAEADIGLAAGVVAQRNHVTDRAAE